MKPLPIHIRTSPMPPTPTRTFRVTLPDGEQLGVLSEARVIKLIRSGVIGPDAMLQRVGSQNWRRADQVAAGIFRELAAAPAAPAEPDDPFAFRPLPSDFEQQGLGGGGMPPADPFAAFGGADAIGNSAAAPWVGPPPALPSMPVAPSIRASSAPDEDTVVTAGFLFMAWLCLPTLALDLLIWALLGFVGFGESVTSPRTAAGGMVSLLPSPYVTSILLCILTAWSASRLPEHARQEGIALWVMKWIALSLLPVLLLLVIRALDETATHAPFIIAAVGIGVMGFACDVPMALTRSLNDRIGPAKWKVSWWLGPTASGFMAASCVCAAAANGWMSFLNVSADDVSLWARFQQSGILLLALIVLGIGTRLIGLLLVAIWGIQLGVRLRKVPLRAVTYRGRFD